MDPAGNNLAAELWHQKPRTLMDPAGNNLAAELWHPKPRTLMDPTGNNLTAELWHPKPRTLMDPAGNKPRRRVVAPKIASSGNEFTVEDEGNFDAAAAAESATAESATTAIQPPFASLERLGLQISAVLAKILDFFHEFDRVNVSQYRPQHFWVFGGAKIDFYGYSVPCDGVQFLEAMWKKLGTVRDGFCCYATCHNEIGWNVG
uniref:Uncharacterized protein n=1 Tax=Fagus sylvatica TaxID=28930 RepID=A0A2N9EVF2_FAGSY